MGRPRKPYFRESDQWWVSRFWGEYVKLARGRENEAAARARFHELMAREALATPTESADVTVAALFEAFLDWSHRHNDKGTYAFYRRYLQSFVDQHGRVLVRELKPYHVTRWLDHGTERTEGGRRAAITAVRRALNWAIKEGYLTTNPLREVEKPPAQRREKVLSDQEKKAIAGAVKDQAFRDLLFALENTGARPGEVTSVTARQVDLERRVWILPRHKTVKKTKRPRVVVLTEPMVELCRGLMEKYPEGPLFRNRYGRPWNKESIRCRFRRLRKKLKLDRGVVCYSYRHTYATDGLEAGVSLAAMWELLGHVDVEMLSRHYGHLDQQVDHLRQAARRVSGQDSGA